MVPFCRYWCTVRYSTGCAWFYCYGCRTVRYGTICWVVCLRLYYIGYWHCTYLHIEIPIYWYTVFFLSDKTSIIVGNLVKLARGTAVCNLRYLYTVTGMHTTSVGDPLLFDADPDPRIRIQLWIRLLASVTLNHAKNYYFSYFFLITYSQAHYLQPWKFNFLLNFVLKFYFLSNLSVRSKTLWEKGRIRIRIHTSD